jgi:hypothetical protein
MTHETTTTEPPPRILAAWCPPGWRRDPMTGKPIMPCIGKLLFPGGDVPSIMTVLQQCREIAPPDDPPIYRHALLLAEFVLVGAVNQRRCGTGGLDQADEVAIAWIVDDLCRLRGTVRIERRGGEWVEVEVAGEGEG